MKGCTWLVSVAALAALLLAGCGSVASVVHQPHPLIFPTVTPGAARVTPGTTLYTFRRTSEGINSIAWSSDSKQIASVGLDNNKILIWDATTGQTALTLQPPDSGEINLAWSPGGKQLASTTGYNGSGIGLPPHAVQVWDTTTGAPELLLTGPAAYITALAWSPDSTRIAASSNDKTVYIWSTINRKVLFIYYAPGPVAALAWSPDGNQIASVSQGTVQVWNALSGASTLIYRGQQSPITSVAWSPDGQTIASGAADGSAQTWDAATGKTIATYTSPQSNAITTLAWSPDSQYLVTASASANGGAIQVWQAATGSVVLTYQGQESGSAVAWSPDGTRIASSDGRTVQVWTAP